MTITPGLALAVLVAAPTPDPSSTETPAPKAHEGRAFHLDVEAETNLPVDVGARITAEFPLRIQLSTSLGGMPGGYVDVINGVVVAAGGYDDATASVIRSALERSLVWRTHAGWRILKRRGLYVQAGYGLVTLGGSATGGDVLAIVTGNPMLSGEGDDVVDLRSTLHMIDAEVGWQFLFVDGHVSLRTALGFAGTVGASTTASVADDASRRPVRQAALEESAAFVEDYLDDLYTRYVFAPVVTVAVGYRFF
ncbi:MAG: hypothetical protein AAGA54_16615 [Myxococcota bacterium]